MVDSVTAPQKIFDEADCLYTEQEVQDALRRMAEDITQQLSSTDPIIFSVMNGGLIITGQLLTQLHFPLHLEYIHASRYRHETSGGTLEWRVRPETPVAGRTVLIIDDILDEGTTLLAIEAYFRHEGAAAVHTAVLVDKQHNRKARPELKADFTGLEAADRFLFGYGMDYQGYWRNAPGIYAVKDL